MIEWLNGEFIEAGPRLDTRDRGFLLGDGAFETLLVVDGRAIFLDAHLRRLKHGLSLLHIGLELPATEVRSVIAILAARNGLASGRAVARLTVSRGASARGLSITSSPEQQTRLLSISRWVAPALLARVIVTGRRRWAASATSSFKHIGGYVENQLALQDARLTGADNGLLLNEHGRVVCASSSNLFAITGKASLRTPALDEGALPGVVRAHVISLAKRAGITVEQAETSPEELRGAALILTNSLIGLQAACLHGEDPPIADLFFQLQGLYEDSVSQDAAREVGSE